jgi:hypothetical protein
LIEAMKIGFNVPSTLFSNEPAEIRRFLAENQGQTIYKTRILDRKLAEEITARELKSVIGGCASQRPTPALAAIEDD